MPTTYLFLSDDSATPTTPKSQLTPRCYFLAESRAEARETFASIEATINRRFGVSAFRAETKRERSRITPAPSELLPMCDEYLAVHGYAPRA